MPTTTTNFGWTVPADTDLVKDGAAAIRTALGGVDTSMVNLKGGTTGQVLAKASATDMDFSWVSDKSGLTLIKSQTIGTTVSSVEVTGAFSSTYDNYLIMINGGVASTTNNLNLQLGATTTGYYGHSLGGVYTSGAVTGFAQSNGANWIDIGGGTAQTLHGVATVLSPNLAKETTLTSNYVQAATAGYTAHKNGYLNNTTQYTAFTILVSSGTITGGTIRVYGYQNS